MDWIELGYWGMFVSSILAATFLPFGSEAVFLGLLYKDFELVPLVFVASTGNTIGGMVTYYMGHLGKLEWLEKWFGISKDKLKNLEVKAKKYGWLFAFFTWLPGIGDPMAAAIGFVRINPVVALIWMAIGKTLRFAAIGLMWKYSIDLW